MIVVKDKSTILAAENDKNISRCYSNTNEYWKKAEK